MRYMKYLNRLQDDALNGRSPIVCTDSDSNTNRGTSPYSKNISLKAYFANARMLSQSNWRNALSITSVSGSNGNKQAYLDAPEE